MLYKSGVTQVFQVRETEADSFYRARNDLLLHPCNPSSVQGKREKGRRQKTRTNLRGRQTGPAGWLLCWAPGIRVEWAEVPLASRLLQQKLRTGKENKLRKNILGLGENHML